MAESQVTGEGLGSSEVIKWQRSIYRYCEELTFHYRNSWEDVFYSHYPLLPYFFKEWKWRHLLRKRKTVKWTKTKQRNTSMCHVPCWALKSSSIRHQLYTRRLGHSTVTAPRQVLLWFVGLCTAGECSSTELHLGPESGDSTRRRLQLPGYLYLPSAHLSMEHFFPHLKKNAQRQFCWSLREKHNTGGNPGQEEMEESHALHRNRRLWT